jgi:hypothetical protein
VLYSFLTRTPSVFPSTLFFVLLHLLNENQALFWTQLLHPDMHASDYLLDKLAANAISIHLNVINFLNYYYCTLLAVHYRLLHRTLRIEQGNN